MDARHVQGPSPWMAQIASWLRIWHARQSYYWAWLGQSTSSWSKKCLKESAQNALKFLSSGLSCPIRHQDTLGIRTSAQHGKRFKIGGEIHISRARAGVPFLVMHRRVSASSSAATPSNLLNFLLCDEIAVRSSGATGKNSTPEYILGVGGAWVHIRARTGNRGLDRDRVG